jgi:hypothetical protein
MTVDDGHSWAMWLLPFTAAVKSSDVYAMSQSASLRGWRVLVAELLLIGLEQDP